MKPNNLDNQVFEKLTVLKRVGSDKRGQSKYLCLCGCGNEKVIFGYNLKNGHTTNCGCEMRKKNGELMRERFSTHKMTGTPLYKVWLAIRARCYQKTAAGYEYYGGKGIRLSKEWEDFENFYRDMKEGYKNGLTIDRKDNDKNYSKENCQWATRKEQANNRTNNRYFTCNGKTLSIPQWSEELGILATTLWNRIYRGWSAERALTKLT